MKFKYHKALLSILILPISLARQPVWADNMSTESLTANRLVTAVLKANPQLQAAQAAWEASLARIDQQATFEDPMFSYTMAPQTIGNSQTVYGQRIEISQKLPWPGKLDLRNEAASYKADIANQAMNSFRLKMVAIARSYFADWYYIHKAIHINQLNQALLKEFRAIAVSRYSTGRASKQDALQAEMEYALLEHQSIVLTQEQRAIRAHINTLLNKFPDSELAVPSDLVAIEALPDIKSLHEQARYTRPELKALAATIEAAKAQSELAIRNNYPDISLKAGYNSLWENTSKHFTVGIGFNLPLFQGKHRAAENEAQAEIKKAEWQRVDFIAKLREDIQISYDQTTESMHVFSLYKNKLLPLAEETLDAAKSDYQSGKGDFLNLISSEKNYMQTQLQAEQALTNIHRHLAELERSVGYFQPFSGTLKVLKAEEAER